MSKEDGRFEEGHKINQEYDYVDVAEKLEAYIDNKDCPILAQFAYENHIPKSSLYDMKDNTIPNLLKRAIDKKEFYLESNGYSGSINSSMAIFGLKQLGWSDKIENTNKNLNLDKNIDEDMTGEEASLIYSSIVKNG